MTGTVKSIPSKNNQQANYAFVKGDDGKEYFLHASELQDDWQTLKNTIALKKQATIEFEVVMGLKGPRAEKARIIL
jgi:cold shock CspA family protein